MSISVSSPEMRSIDDVICINDYHPFAIKILVSIRNLEELMLQQPQVELMTNHFFAGEVYEREIRIPAGVLLIGKTHRNEHLAKLTQGEMSLWNDGEIGLFAGPKTFVSRPGTKRLGYARTDCVFSTFHHVGEMRDLEMIEQSLVFERAELVETELNKEELLCLS